MVVCFFGLLGFSGRYLDPEGLAQDHYPALMEPLDEMPDMTLGRRRQLHVPVCFFFKGFLYRFLEGFYKRVIRFYRG